MRKPCLLPVLNSTGPPLPFRENRPFFVGNCGRCACRLSLRVTILKSSSFTSPCGHLKIVLGAKADSRIPGSARNTPPTYSYCEPMMVNADQSSLPSVPSERLPLLPACESCGAATDDVISSLRKDLVATIRIQSRIHGLSYCCRHCGHWTTTPGSMGHKPIHQR